MSNYPVYYINLECRDITLTIRSYLVILTAMTYFKRFYLTQHASEFNPYIIRLTCLYVAAKVEEAPTPEGYKINQRGIDVAKLVETVGNQGKLTWNVNITL